jgi:hypothetical protein
MTKYNVDLMLAVREQITSHPETHDQTMWGRKTECGTTYCIAGWAAVLSGAEPLWDIDIDDTEEAATALHAGRGDKPYQRSIRTIAEEALGISYQEAGRLFPGALSRAEALANLDELIEKGKNES